MNKDHQVVYVFLKSEESNSHELQDLRFLYRVWTGWSIGYGLGVCHFGESVYSGLLNYDPTVKMTEAEFNKICQDPNFVGICSSNDLIEICLPFYYHSLPQYHDDEKRQLWRIQLYLLGNESYSIDVDECSGHTQKTFEH